MGRRLRMTMTAAATAAAALAACAGGGAIPDDFTVVETDWAAVGVPEHWEAEVDDGTLRAVSEPRTGQIRQQVLVRRDETFSGSLDVGFDVLHNLLQFRTDDLEVGDEREVEVDGAGEAMRAEASWTGENDAGEAVPIQAVNVVAVAGDGALVVLEINAASDDFDEGWARPVVESFQVR